MITIRCDKCHKYYALKHSDCPYCDAAKSRNYYIRLHGKYYKGGDILQIAREIEANLKKKARIEGIAEYNEKCEITFSEFLDKYFLPYYKTKVKSYSNVSGKIEYFRSYFGHIQLNKVPSADIDFAVSEIGKIRKPRTRDYYLSMITRIFNYAQQRGFITKSPVETKLLKVDNSRVRYLTADEEKKLLLECRTSRAATYLYPVVMIALYTGMRKNEIMTLRPEDVKGGYIHIKGEKAKTNKGRMIPIHDDIKEFLANDFDYGKYNFHEAFASAVRRSGIKDFKFHDLRHTFASKLVQKGVELYVVKELLGHSTMEMTQRYAHLAPDSLLNAVKKL